MIQQARLHFRNAWLGLRENGWLRTWDRARDFLRRRWPWKPRHHLTFPQQKAIHALAEVPCSANPLASIIVPVFNKVDYTLVCLAAVAACNDASSYELIVVDDGSTDATAARVSGIKGVRYVRNPSNEGFIGSCNRGAAEARGTFLVFLNNDTAVQAGWLDSLLATFETHPEAGLVGSKLLYPSGMLQEAGGILYADGRAGNYGRFDAALDPRYTHVRDADYCSGAAVTLRKTLFEELGGFDERYRPAYYEDADLAMRVRELGYQVLYQPQSLVVHFEGITSGISESEGVKAYQVRNRGIFFQRWQERLSERHPAWGVSLDLAVLGPRRTLLIFKHPTAALNAASMIDSLISDGCPPIIWLEDSALPEPWQCAWEARGVEIWSGYWIIGFDAWMRRHHSRLSEVWVASPADIGRYARVVERWKDTILLHAWAQKKE